MYNLLLYTTTFLPSHMACIINYSKITTKESSMWPLWVIAGVFAGGILLCAFPFQKIKVIRGKGTVLLKGIYKSKDLLCTFEQNVEQMINLNPELQEVTFYRFCDFVIPKIKGRITDKSSFRKVKSLCYELFINGY